MELEHGEKLRLFAQMQDAARLKEDSGPSPFLQQIEEHMLMSLLLDIQDHYANPDFVANCKLSALNILRRLVDRIGKVNSLPFKV